MRFKRHSNRAINSASIHSINYNAKIALAINSHLNKMMLSANSLSSINTVAGLFVNGKVVSIGWSRGLGTSSMEGHIADILKIRGPKLTQIKLKVTVNKVGDRVISPEK